jgi:hypothetical protein
MEENDLHQYSYGQIVVGEMGGTCRLHEIDEK